MKALKEKRISLRSLWRRGLVILSLFALVFASCSDSSGGGPSGSAADADGPRVVYFNVKTNPTEDQFFGQALDLTGIELDVFYADGSRKTETDTSKITVFPRVATGYYYTASGTAEGYRFSPMTSYEVYYKGVHGNNRVSIADKMWWIYRSNTPGNVTGVRPGDIYVPGSMDLGIHLTGAANIKQEAYADDDTYNLSGLTLEADYVKNYADNTKGFPNPQVIRKPIKLADVAWEIKPRYDKTAFEANAASNNGEGYYDGYLYLTVGRVNDWENIYGGSLLGDYLDYGENGLGITVMVPLAKVWTVKTIEVIYDPDAIVKSSPADYYYWEENTRDAWIKRLGDNAKLKIAYTSGTTDEKYIKDLADKQRIYWNSNTVQGSEPQWTEEGIYEGDPMDFDIMTVRYPFTKKSVNLGVRLYYRGAQTQIDVYAFTLLTGVTANVDIVDFWPNPKWDNDKDNGEGGPAELAKKLDVKAHYTAVNAPDQQREYTLKYYHAPDIWFRKDGGINYNALWELVLGKSSQFYGPYYKTGPYYIFAADGDTEDDLDLWPNEDIGDNTSTYAKGYLKYQNNQAKNKATLTNVVVKHEMVVWSDDVPASGSFESQITRWYEQLFKARYYNMISGAFFNSFVYPFGFNWNTSGVDPEFIWNDHDGGDNYNGMLPNGWSPYDPNAPKVPGFIDKTTGERISKTENGHVNPNAIPDPSRNFGPKVSQAKKAKVKVNWVNEYK